MLLYDWGTICTHLVRDESGGWMGGRGQEVMRDPVVWADGMSYEREVFEMWLRKSDTSPVTGETFPGQKTVVPNFSLRSLIKEWKERTGFSDEWGGRGVAMVKTVESGIDGVGVTG